MVTSREIDASGEPSGTGTLELARRVFACAERRGSVTFDPEDFKAHSIVVWALRGESRLRRAVRLPVYGAAAVFPVLTRLLLGIAPATSAGGLAWYARACCAMYEATDEPQWLDRARELLRELLAHRVPVRAGMAWGLPFDWQAGTFYPRGTAFTHTTACAGRAFLDVHKQSGEDWLIAAAAGACEFFLRGLPRSTGAEGGVSLAYSPADTLQVLNTDADAASLLLHYARDSARAGEESDLAHALLRHLVGSQGEGGAWGYYADRPLVADHVHTGMLIMAVSELAELATELGLRQSAAEALRRGADFYMHGLFDRDGFPRFTTDRRFPLDAHAVGQALITLDRLSADSVLAPEQRDAAAQAGVRAQEWLEEGLLDPEGCSAHRKYRWGRIRLYSLRWAHAVICFGLARRAARAAAQVRS